MKDYLKFIYDNYRSYRVSNGDKEDPAYRFQTCWFTFENYLDHFFGHTGKEDSFRKRTARFEEHLRSEGIHEAFWKRVYRLDEAQQLAELEPRIFRQSCRETSAHDAFASDYSRLMRGGTPREPLVRLLNLLYTVRCNSEHGQKPLPRDWEDMRQRNERVFSLTVPLLAQLDELVINQFVALGIFSYGTLQDASGQSFSEVERLQGLRIRGHIFDMGSFPAWRYNTWGWITGTVLCLPSASKLKFMDLCDEIEGRQFERWLTLAYDQNDKPQHIVWAYHFNSEPDLDKRIQDGIWKSPCKTECRVTDRIENC